MDPTNHDLVDLAIGAIFVIIYAARRFNTPSTNRSSTTAGRYFLTVTLYCAIATGTFLLLAEFPHLMTAALSEVAGKGTPVSPDTRTLAVLSNPLLAALLMTVLLPNLPLLNVVDRWIFRQLQSIAAIPYEVRRLSAELRRLPMSVSADLQAAVRDRLLGEGFAESDIRFEPGTSQTQLWTGLTALFLRVEDWEGDRRMAGYIEAFGEALRSLRARREALIAKARICFRLLGETAGMADTEKGTEAVRRFAGDLNEQVLLLRSDLLDFVSRGILHAELTVAGRISRLATLGFRASPPPRLLTLNQMMGVFGVVGVIMLAGSIISTLGRTLDHGALLALILMVALIYSAAVACAVVPKAHWAWARRTPGGERPFLFYFVAGILAVGVSQTIGLAFNCVRMGSIADGLQRHQLTYPWSVLTFAAAVAVAFLVDNRRPTKALPWLWRVLEGMAQAAVMLGAAYVAHGWLMKRAEGLVSTAAYSVPKLPDVLTRVGLIGFCIGFLVPTWYREAPRERAVDSIEPAPAPPGEGTIVVAGAR
jgi:hypothetical protein